MVAILTNALVAVIEHGLGSCDKKLTYSLSQKGSDPLEAKRNLTLFCCLAGEGLTPFGIGSYLFRGYVDDI
jgi:hypothetical protein